MTLISSSQVGTNRIELVVEAKGEQFAQAVDKALSKNAKKIALPGFRKGKVPRAMIEKIYGRQMFFEEAVNDLYPAAYSEAVKEAGIQPVDSADIEVLDVSEEGFSFKATVTTRPVPELGAYKGLSAVREHPQVSDEEIDKQLLSLREQYARVIAVTDRPAKGGDIADINFEGFVDGTAFAGGKGENYSLTLGSGSFIPGFEQQVEGHKPGEEFDVEVTFPEEYGEKSLAGKPAVFKVRLNGLQEKQYPAFDDEFAKDISEFDTLEAYKADLKAKLADQHEARAAAEFENRLLDQVIEDMKVEVPDCMVNSRVEELVQEFSMRMSGQGLKLDDFMRYTGESKDKFYESFRPQAEKQVKVRLALEAVAQAESLAATEQELSAEYEKMAEQYKTDAQKLRSVISETELGMDVACRKALDLIVANAKPEEPKESEEPKASEEPKPAKKTRAPKAQKPSEEPEASQTV